MDMTANNWNNQFRVQQRQPTHFLIVPIYPNQAAIMNQQPRQTQIPSKSWYQCQPAQLLIGTNFARPSITSSAQFKGKPFHTFHFIIYNFNHILPIASEMLWLIRKPFD